MGRLIFRLLSVLVLVLVWLRCRIRSDYEDGDEDDGTSSAPPELPFDFEGRKEG